MATEHPIVLFDGVCSLCERTVRFLVARDPHGCFRFAPLQSRVAAELLAQRGVCAAALDTVVLIEGARCLTRSDAALAIARRLPGAWRLLGLLAVVPRPLREWVYRVVASHRYRWFGRRSTCLVPTPELKSRFLE